MKNRKPRPQIEKQIDGITRGKNLTAGIGVEIKSNVIDLKSAQEGYYFDSNWKNLLGGVFIDKGTTNSAGSLSVDHLGALQLLPASKSTLGGVKAGKNVSIQKDGTLDVEAAGGGGGFFSPNYIIVQGYKVYREDFLSAGSTFNFVRSNGTRYNAHFYDPPFTKYADASVKMYTLSGDQKMEIVRFYFGNPGETAIFCYANYKYTQGSGNTMNLNSRLDYAYGTDISGIGWVFTAIAIGPPGNDPNGFDCPYGYVVVYPYCFYKASASNAALTFALKLYNLCMPFASMDEYIAAAGGEVT